MNISHATDRDIGIKFLVAMATVLLTCPLYGANLCKPSRFFNSNICEFFSRGEYTQLYANPGKASKRVNLAPGWTESIITTSAKFYEMPNGWLKYNTSYTTPNHKHIEITGWIPVETVVDSNSLKQVKACWPIKRIAYSEGDFAIDVLSDTQGRYYNTYTDAHMTKPIGHVYFADNIVFYAGPTTPKLRAELKIKMTKESLRDFSDQFIAGYDSKTRRLYPDGYKPDDLVIEYHSDAELRGCQNIVVKE